jgi:hypothetical protein
MRLSEWRKAAPTRDSVSNRVMAVLNPVLQDLGADPDSECWVVWGDDPEMRYAVLAPTPGGVISAAVRLTGTEEGPRATAKLVRWSKLSVSELSVEASGGHRIVAVQVEGQVLKGMDQEADRICEFVRGLIAGIDGRAPQAIPVALMQAGPGRASAAKRIPVSGTGAAAVRSKPKGLALAKPKEPPKGLAVAKPKAQPKSLALAQPKAPPKATAPKRLHAVPAAGTGAAGLAVQRAADLTPSRSALRQGIPATTAPPSALPGPTASPAPPKPIAARAAARRPRSHPEEGVGVDAPGAPATPDESSARRRPVEPEPDRSEWIGPHPIEEAPSREPKRPRPWIP